MRLSFCTRPWTTKEGGRRLAAKCRQGRVIGTSESSIKIAGSIPIARMSKARSFRMCMRRPVSDVQPAASGHTARRAASLARTWPYVALPCHYLRFFLPGSSQVYALRLALCVYVLFSQCCFSCFGIHFSPSGQCTGETGGREVARTVWICVTEFCGATLRLLYKASIHHGGRLGQ